MFVLQNGVSSCLLLQFCLFEKKVATAREEHHCCRGQLLFLFCFFSIGVYYLELAVFLCKNEVLSCLLLQFCFYFKRQERQL